MRKVTKNITNKEAKQVEEIVKKCIRLLRKKQYELDLPKNAMEIALDVLEVKKVLNSPSRAGARLIRINLGYWQVGNHVHTEYKAFDNHPTIGRIRVTEDVDHLLISVSHEVAHFIQYRYAPRVSRFRGQYKKPHGKCFRDIYMYLRRDLVNPIIKDKY